MINIVLQLIEILDAKLERGSLVMGGAMTAK